MTKLLTIAMLALLVDGCSSSQPVALPVSSVSVTPPLPSVTSKITALAIKANKVPPPPVTSFSITWTGTTNEIVEIELATVLTKQFSVVAVVSTNEYTVSNSFPQEFFSVLVLYPYSALLSWTASKSTNVTGYVVSCGGVSGVFTNSISVGNVTNATVPNLTGGMTYYFAVRSTNSAGYESPFSNEITNTIAIKGASNLKISPT